MASHDKPSRRTGMTGFVAPARSPLHGLGRVRVIRVPQPSNDNQSEGDRTLFSRMAIAAAFVAGLLALAVWRAYTAF